ncbi:MAG: phosphoglycerate kinase [Candidatus Stahlbacteria bacterium]|nr:phosphoglycerate kinase [Candidatus Stahlbacteria bacterium]
MKSLRELDIKGKRVLMRVDFNVPIKEGKVTDDTRIRASLPSIKYVIDNGGKLILMSHLGRPKGKINEAFSLRPVADCLSKILKRQVKFIPCCIESQATNLMQEGDTLLLENVRFHPEEENNDLEYAKKLAQLGDVYVNDAFGSTHRAHSSVAAITFYFREKAMGLLVEKEIKYLSLLLETPKHPFIAVLGGAKVADKIEVIQNLLPRIDKLLLGGGMVFTFFKGLGYEIGNSLLETDKLDLVKKLLDTGGNKILLPKDIVIGDKLDKDAQKKEVVADKIEQGWIGLDIGKQTITLYQSVLNTAKTIFWNGPMGVFELDRFADGTRAIANKIAEREATTVIGGGDTIAAVNKFGYSDKVTHISTGGGASLEFLAGLKLPGIEALE